MKSSWDTIRFSGAGIFFVAAGVLALLTGLLIFWYLRTAVPSGHVFVINRDLPPGSELARRDLATRQLPVSAVPDDAVVDLSKVVGRRVRMGLVDGDILRAAHLVSEHSSDLGRTVAEKGPEYRAVMLPGELVPAVKRLLPGDRLELTGVLPVQDRTTNSVMAVPLGTAVVLEVETKSGRSEKGAVLVAMQADEVSRMALALRAGSLTITVMGEGTVTPGRLVRLEQLIRPEQAEPEAAAEQAGQGQPPGSTP